MITLFDDWVIVVNDRDFTLAKYKGTRTDKRSGKESPNLSVYGYFSSVSGALRHLGKELTRQKLRGRETTLKEAIRVIEESNAKVSDLLDRVLEDDGK